MRTSSRRPIGVTYLHHLLHRFDFDKRLTLAAYNQGRLASAGTAFPETRAFVRNVVRLQRRMGGRHPRPGDWRDRRACPW